MAAFVASHLFRRAVSDELPFCMVLTYGAFVTFMISLRRIQMFLLTYLLTALKHTARLQRVQRALARVVVNQRSRPPFSSNTPDVQHSVAVPSQWLRHVHGTACRRLSGMHRR